MPYKSMKQERFFHTKAGEAKLGKKNVDEFDQASAGMSLPETATPIKRSNRYTDLMKKDEGTL